jgi:hypothetical protein
MPSVIDDLCESGRYMDKAIAITEFYGNRSRKEKIKKVVDRLNKA